MTTRGLPIKERFELYVYPEPNTGCWLWGGTKGSRGYGHFRDGNQIKKAHRMAHEIYKGPIPKDLQIDHLCRVRCCVNPDHLELVTPKENTRRGLTGWNMAIKTHCPQGHPYDDQNTYVTPIGGRQCRTCRRDRKRRAKSE